MTLIEKIRAAETAVKAAQDYRCILRRGDGDLMEMGRLTYAAEDALRAVAAEFGIAATTLRQLGGEMGVNAGTVGVAYNPAVNQWTIVFP